jgi:hypothetical protein
MISCSCRAVMSDLGKIQNFTVLEDFEMLVTE